MNYKIQHIKGGGIKIISEVKTPNGEVLYIGSWNLKGDREKLLKEHEERMNNKEALIKEWQESRKI